MIHILFEAGSLLGNKTGVGYYTEALISSLATEYSDEVQLCGFYFNFLGRKKVDKLPSIPNTQYKEIRWFPPKLLSLLRRIGLQPSLKFFLPSSVKADAILFPNFTSFKTSRPNLVVIYDLGFMDIPEYVSQKNADFLSKFVPKSIQNADTIICISEFTKSRLQDIYSWVRCPIIVIPVALPNQNVLQANEPKHILHVGTLEPRKNIENLVNGYALLPPEVRRRHNLVLCGGNGWNNESLLKRIAELQGEGIEIKTVGYVDENAREDLYRSALTVISVAHYEGFGMPVLEAAKYARPLILSNIPVYKEVSKGAAVFCDQNNPKDIARVLLQTISAPQKDEVLRRNAQKILQEYSWQKNAKLLYDQIVKLI